MECLVKELLELIIKDGTLSQIDQFLTTSHSSFEEIPIFSRHDELVNIEKHIKKEDLFVSLVDVATFLAKMIKRCYSRKFVAITFYDIDEDMTDFGYVIPNLFVTNKYELVNSFIIPENRINVDEHPILKKYFNESKFSNYLQFYKTLTKDKYGDIERIYMLM